MILDRKIFKYQNKPLIEKVTIKLPFRYEALFQNEGCFLFIKGTESTIHAATKKSKIKSKEAILLKCGPYFVDWVKHETSKQVDVIAIHLYPDVIKALYNIKFPESLINNNEDKVINQALTNDLLDNFIDNIYFYFENPQLINKDILELKLKELVLILIQSNKSNTIQQVFSEIFAPRLTNIRTVVNSHLYSNFNISELSKLAGMSPSSFKRAFVKEFNDSPRHYILNKRIEKAKLLLKNTNLSLSEIAYDIGFNDSLYFSRIFKKRTGVSPSLFRTQNQ